MRIRIVSLIITILLVGNCPAQNLVANKDDNSLLWQVSGNGLKKASYLFGTFHLLCKDYIHFSGQLKKAIANADTVYMEIKMDDPIAMMSGIKFFYMKDGKTLKDLYTGAEYKRIEAYFNDSVQVPLMAVQAMKPELIVALLYPKMLKCDSTSGIEEEVITIAKTNKKQIKGLETMEFQASVFDSIPYSEQAKDLINSIDSINIYAAEFNAMLQVYLSQQIDKIQDMFNDPSFGLNGHEDILLDDRNKNWVSQLKKIMPGESVFVAVGAGHLVGSNGLINLLRREGYILTPLLNK